MNIRHPWNTSFILHSFYKGWCATLKNPKHKNQHALTLHYIVHIVQISISTEFVPPQKNWFFFYFNYILANNK